MNNLISIIISLVLYNPLEASVLLTSAWLLRGEKFRNKKFIVYEFLIKCFIVGTLNFCVQYPERYFQNSIFYVAFLMIENFILMGTILKIFGYNNNLLNIVVIMLFFNFSLTIIIDLFKLPIIISQIENNFICQLTGNLIIRLIQFSLIITIFGGFLMLKKFLKKDAKNNLGKMVASTVRGWGETKISKKLAKEVKESK